MRRIAVFLALSAIFLIANVSAASPPKPEIVDIHGQVKGREARIHFTLRNAFSPEMVEALKSGIEISFKTIIRVEKVHRRWFNAPMGEYKFSRSVQYDALSMVYRLNRGGHEELLPDIFSALSGMTHFEVRMPLSGEAESGKKYRAFVRTRLDKVGLSEPLRSIFFFSSLWDIETDWAKGYLNAP
ncbi:MAG: DUF4390 domain-containing protein [Deltaproteobacteria bacterium]|nr:DUF4390 domain-containing protein [Deltaproteobacteria bacterium]